MTAPYGYGSLRGSTGLEKRKRKDASELASKGVVDRGGIDEGSNAFDALSTEDKLGRYLASGQNSVNASTAAATSAAMPEFNQALQGIRESSIRRGVNLGDIGTRDEGSLASAFQRNIANVAGQGAMQNYNTGLERLYGYRDWRTGQDNAKAARRAGAWSALGGLAGTALGNPAIGGAVAKWFTGGAKAAP